LFINNFIIFFLFDVSKDELKAKIVSTRKKKVGIMGHLLGSGVGFSQSKLFMIFWVLLFLLKDNTKHILIYQIDFVFYLLFFFGE
jgi:hypothetical protein